MTLESVPLRTIASIEPHWTEGKIVRRNGVRTLTVMADLKRHSVASLTFNKIRKQVEEAVEDEGVILEFGGDHEFSIDNMIPLGWSLFVSIILIFFILLLEFKTYRRSLLIMSTMLLSFQGAAIGLWITGYPFSVTSFIGLIGLVGIVVRNGIILIDYAFELINKQGLNYKDAAIKAGKRRMRPIFLTSMAAAMGVVPMMISQSPLWAPMATVICFGMIIGMILTLFILPVLYWKSTSGEYKKTNKYVEDSN